MRWHRSCARCSRGGKSLLGLKFANVRVKKVEIVNGDVALIIAPLSRDDFDLEGNFRTLHMYDAQWLTLYFESVVLSDLISTRPSVHSGSASFP